MGNAVTKVEAGGLHTNKASQTQVLDIPFKPNCSSLRSVSRRDLSLLAGLSLLLHGGIWWYINNAPAEQLETPPKIPEMVVEFSSPTPPAPEPPPPPPLPPPPPPPEPEPPKVEEPAPPPVDENAVKPPPKPEKPKPKPVEKPKPKPKPVQKPTPPAPPAPPQPTPAPPAPKAPPAAPAPPAPVKETAAVSGLASLGNPPPEYPSLALRRGWEGSVTLRIRVLPNGRAGSVDVTRSSGKKQLDDAAVEAVRGWKFIPAKRGDTPIEGFATQTIDFKLPQ